MGTLYTLDGLGLVYFNVVMKKLLLTLLLITELFSSQTWGLSIDKLILGRYDGLFLRNDGLYYKEYTDIPFTDEISGFKGTFWLNGKFKDGKKEGLWKIYNEDGSLDRTETYKNGQIQ